MSDETTRPIRIFILDPYVLIRSGLRSIIENEPGMKVVGEAGDAANGLEMIAYQKPDVLLLKLSPTGDPGPDVISRLIEVSGSTRIILLTTTENFQTCAQAVENGALGVFPQTHTPQVLFKAIRKVHEGEVWLERSMMANLVNTMSSARRRASVDPDTARIQQISERERQVIQLIGLGLKNRQIAAQLCISETTVRHHLTSIFSKLGVSDRLELLVFANRTGLTKQMSGSTK